jgi:hypothetical protein
MIQYEYDFIMSLRNNYYVNNNKFDELNKYAIPQTSITKKQQQLNMKYQSNKWRYNDKEDIFKKKINGVLNKISLDNYEELRNIIQNIGNNISVDKYCDLEYFVDRIINKAIDDPFYSDVYGKLLKDICRYKWFVTNTNKIIEDNYISFYDLLLIKSKELYDKIYEEKRVDKVNCNNIILFINQLYLNNLLSNYIYISCIYGLLNNPTELNIELICKMLIKCGNKMNIYIKNELAKIMEKVDIIYKNIKNTRLKYLLLDVIELYQSDWEKIIETKINKSDIDDKLINILEEFIMNESIDDILYILEEYKTNDILKFIELSIKQSFTMNQKKQELLFELFNEIIRQKKLNKSLEGIIDIILNNIEDIMLDSPKCIENFNKTLDNFLDKKFIPTHVLNNIISTKNENIKKLFQKYTFSIVKKNYKKLDNISKSRYS